MVTQEQRTKEAEKNRNLSSCKSSKSVKSISEDWKYGKTETIEKKIKKQENGKKKQQKKTRK